MKGPFFHQLISISLFEINKNKIYYNICDDTFMRMDEYDGLGNNIDIHYNIYN